MEDGWKVWKGGERPVDEYDLVLVKYNCGEISTVPCIAKSLDWQHNYESYNVVAYCVIKETVSEESTQISDEKPIASDGGSSGYYNFTIENEAGETIQCEMKDIIRCVYGDNFSLGNIAKAARRMYEASQGRGKEGASIAYDANKVRYFASEFERWNKGD